MGTTKSYRGTKVLGGKKGTRKIGKIGVTIFHPTEPRVVGFVVKRPDFLLMIKRKDKFLAFDAFEEVDGRFRITKDKESWDEPAIERMGVDYDKCIIWENMPMRTEDGSEIGRVGIVEFNDKTGRVEKIIASDGATAKALIGSVEIPIEFIKGYRDGFLVLRPAAAEIEPSGGLAAKAGANHAKAKNNASKAAAKTGEAVNKGAYALGRGIGKTKSKIEELQAEKEEETVEETEEEPDEVEEREARAERHAENERKVGKAIGDTSNKFNDMFSGFKEEYDKARHSK